MRSKTSFRSLCMSLLLCLCLLWPTVQVASQTTPGGLNMGAWLDSITYTIVNGQDAVQQLQDGNIDLYASGLSFNNFAAIRDSGLSYTNSNALYYDILFNPCGPEFTNGKFNPFNNRKIREAMNWLVDRNSLNQNIYAGAAQPKWFAITNKFPDYVDLAADVRRLEAFYAYDLERARGVVTAEMNGMGAALVGGKWSYKGQPITLIFIIRNDSDGSRIPLGNTFADQLEEIGFTVERQYLNGSDAAAIWIASLPSDGLWHLYTAAWGNTILDRDQGNIFQEMYLNTTPQGIPAFLENVSDPEFQEIGDRLAYGQYSTAEERRAMMARALELSLQDSLQVFLIEGRSYLPYQNSVEADADLAAGFDSPVFPYTFRFNNQSGGQAKVGLQDLLVEPWNSVAGSNWLSDSIVQNSTMNWGTVPHPQSGLRIPKMIDKGELVVKAGLPVRKTLDWVSLSFASNITVPGDAWVDWDAQNQRWITAAEKAASDPGFHLGANVKSTVYYPRSLWLTKWHDGSSLSMGDFVMNMIITFDRAKPESKIYDEQAVPGFETFMQTFKGIKIISTDPLVIETYEDGYELDAENNIYTWYPVNAYGGPVAWHNLAPAIFAEQENRLAFSSDKAQSKRVGRTDFITGPTLTIQAQFLNQLAASKAIPYAPTLSQFISQQEITARYDNLQNWYQARGHFWIGTGPYYIQQVLPAEQKIVAARFQDYHPSPCSTVTEISAAECDALATLYYGTAGGSWANKTNWLMTNTPGNWQGVTVSGGHVTRLSLPSNNLSGAIPAQIGNLTALQVLDLNNNRLEGAIPAELANLSALADPGNGPAGGDGLSLDYNRLDVPDPYPSDPPTALQTFLLPKDPDWQMTQSILTDIPAGDLQIDAPDGGLVLEIPSGAADRPITLEYVPLPAPSHQNGLREPANANFRLIPYDENGMPVTGLALVKPITVAIQYTDADIAGLDENTLFVYHWDSTRNQWRDASTTCTPQSTYLRDIPNNRLAVEICHLTEFGLFAEPIGLPHIYFPLIQR